MIKKSAKIVIIGLFAFMAVGFGTGITFAASYKSPEETTTYQFGEMTSSNYNFQSLAYYFAGGSGTSEDPYLVKNAQHLRNLSKLQNSGAMPNGQYISLDTSFQYEGDEMEPIGTQKYPFTGVFNGQDYLITGLKVSTDINIENSAYVGMFGVVGTDSLTGTVHRLLLAGPSIIYTGSATTVKLGIVAGSKNTTVGRLSVVENIQIYGGTSQFKLRAYVSSSVTITGGDGIVGIGGSATSSFVSSLSNSPSYTSTPHYTNGFSAGDEYHLWNNSGTVENSN